MESVTSMLPTEGDKIYTYVKVAQWHLQKLSSAPSESVCGSSFHYINAKFTWQYRQLLRPSNKPKHINESLLLFHLNAEIVLSQCKCYSLHSEAFLYMFFDFSFLMSWLSPLVPSHAQAPYLYFNTLHYQFII